MVKPKRVPRLRVNFIWTFAGNVVFSASQWGTLVLLAKLGSPELVGQFSLGLAVAMPVLMLTNLQLRSVQTTDVQGDRAFADYLGFRVITTALALAAILLICFGMRYSKDVIWLVFAVAIAQAVEAISEIYYGRLQLSGRMDRIAKSMILRGLIAVTTMGVIFYITNNLLYGAAGLALARVLVLVFYDARDPDRAGTIPLLPRKGFDLSLVRLALPLGIVSLLLSLNTNVPRYFIEWASGSHDLGIFSALAFLLSAGNIVVGALGQSAFVPLAKSWADGDIPGFLILLRKLIGVGMALGLAGFFVAQVAGAWLLNILYGPEYAQHADALVWLMAAAGLGYLSQFLGYAITASKHFNVQIPLFAAVTASVAISSYFLVPSQGLFGAVLAILIAMVVQLAGCVLVLALRVSKRGNVVTMALPRTA